MIKTLQQVLRSISQLPRLLAAEVDGTVKVPASKGTRTHYVAVEDLASYLAAAILESQVGLLDWLNAHGVRYDTLQTLTDYQKAVARANIDAELSTTGRHTIDTVAPDDPQEGWSWLDTETGRSFIYVVTDELLGLGAWVEQFGGSSYPAPNVVDSNTLDHIVGALDENSYVRLLMAADKTITVPVTGTSLNPAVGSVFTYRNVGTGDATIEADAGVYLIKATGAEIIPTGTTGQLVFLGSNTWEIQ